MIKPQSFYKGFEAKTEEIKEMGWVASRDKFNLDYPSGQKFDINMSSDAIWYAQGEFEAICEYKEKY